MIDKQVVLKELIPHHKIIHRNNKVGFLSPARDYVISMASNELKSGEFVQSFFTVDYPDCPEVEKVTRSQFLSGLWIITKIDDKNTKITKITECDLPMKPACGPHVQNLIKELLKQ